MARKQKYLATPEGKAKRELGAKWIERVKGATSLENDWLDDAQMATKAYTNEEKAETSEKTLGKRYDFNILFSNVETIVPAVINSSPVPDIRRRFNDPDPAARVVSDILERAISVQIDDSRLQVELEAAAQDAFLAGRGIVRIKFHGDIVGGEPDKEELEDAAEAADGRGPVEGNDVPDYDDGDGAESADTLEGIAQMGHNGGPSLERLENERIGFEAVSWKDYRHGPSKRWQDRPWDAFRFVISKDDEHDSFDSALISSQFDASETKTWAESGEDICGWEIWCKKTKKVYFVNDNGIMLKVVDDPLGLSNFFPVPTPMQPIEVTGRLKPVNPFSIYRKLADQLDTISKRIDVLTKAMKVKGWYSGTEETLKSVIDLEDDEFAPIPDGELWSKSAGGIAAAIAFWPIEKFIVALQQLYSAREQTKQAIYEITGISDIVRGASSAAETATAQQIKSQWGSLRIQKMQRMMERYARDLFVMMTEIIASRFTLQTLQEMTSIPILTTPTDTPEQVQQKNSVIALMRGKLAMYYRIDVESDSTIRADLTRQKAEVSQFLQGASAYFAAVAPLVQQGALPADAAVEIFASTSRMFNLGKSVEDTLEKMVTDARTKADAARKTAETGQGGNPPPDPAQIDTQIKTQAAQQSETRLQAEFDARMQRELSKAKYEDAKAAKELIIAGLNEQLKQLELQIRQADLQLKQRQLGMTLPAGFQEIQQ
ncbi:hypothetical protein FY145_01085 [Agrobacterium tumefaciens]|uniref:hypothetical protein n=1 Tax=Agrobacterium tumefaciens TaxID=358 RepID=UPI0021D37305|nr:hypothetical protein [Agrobacterium tumefaciens]UXS69169.1 hypothetical protein FY146_01085 [Agrobacterium tumefaciens]UXS76832.1 hypothetical protein FY145_01085 [Agrobacterium tumefaciens]